MSLSSKLRDLVMGAPGISTRLELRTNAGNYINVVLSCLLSTRAMCLVPYAGI